ncbi:ATPase [Planoprotostelium fungivorum]|uniref:ATPase n=1 Tax=Planoprotostelium fungivorum TaxID=1890364 RepID=A0A2P6MVW4_9EUKA|nr:ATPase [Planoprotostelium fungivorum]
MNIHPLFLQKNKPQKESQSKGGTKRKTPSNDEPQLKPAEMKRQHTPHQDQPLAERNRPTEWEDMIGQDALVGEEGILTKIVRRAEMNSENSRPFLPSIILWGPPGSGKTTVARLLGRKIPKSTFVQLSAVDCGLAKVREVMEKAANEKRLNTQRITILFVDEIHRFNKAQQDAFLPFVENGTVVLIGATTENPSFECNSALLSRCKVLTMKKLEDSDVERVLHRSVEKMKDITIDPSVIQQIAQIADGDARHALNMLETCIQLGEDQPEGNKLVGMSSLTSTLQRTGGDVDASLYWLGRMLVGGEDPLFIARRLVRFASESVNFILTKKTGLADPQALILATSGFQATQLIGMPECDVILSQVASYLALAPKSTAVYKACLAVKECVRSQPNLPVPLHICNAPTKMMKDLGYAKGYIYNPDHKGPVDQSYLPDAMIGHKFFHDDSADDTHK